MITAHFLFGESGFVEEMEISGHAGSAPKGGDLVCAAVSAQVALLEIALLLYEGERQMKKSEGFFSVSGTSSPEVQGILKSLHFSFLALSKEYRRFLTVKEFFGLEELWQQKKAVDPVKTDAIANPNA